MFYFSRKPMLLKWLILTLAILMTSYLLPGVSVANVSAAIIAALVLGLINIFIKPLVLILTLPINILTLGLFTFIINALMILLAAAIVPGFDVISFWWALLFSVILSIILYALNSMV